MALILAPHLHSCSTASTYPYLAATCNGVSWFWNQIKKKQEIEISFNKFIDLNKQFTQPYLTFQWKPFVRKYSGLYENDSAGQPNVQLYLLAVNEQNRKNNENYWQTKLIQTKFWTMLMMMMMIMTKWRIFVQLNNYNVEKTRTIFLRTKTALKKHFVKMIQTWPEQWLICRQANLMFKTIK